MDALLSSLTVGVVGSRRRLHAAGRLLHDLGARVFASAPLDDPVDELWLGPREPWAPGEPVDVALVDADELPDGFRARRVVRNPDVSTRGTHHPASLDEAGLAAVGGMAVAIGEPDRAPLPLPQGCVDALVGTHAAAAAVAACLTGATDTEVAAADVVAWAVSTNVQIYLPFGLRWFRDGRRASGSGACYPYGLFEAADGLFAMIGRTERDWRNLVEAMGDPDWADDERFADPRVFGRERPDEADALVSEWTRSHTRDELMSIMVDSGFAGAAVLRPEEVLELPSLADRWQHAAVPDQEVGAVRVPGPVQVVRRPAPGPLPRRPVHRSLDDLLVLDLSWAWSGPAVGVALAELGATVLKIESGTRSDNTRLRGTPVDVELPPGVDPRDAVPYFHALNRGKRSVTLDLRTEAGRSVLQDLAAQADVIVENLTEGVMARFGIAPEQVLARNPDCVFLSLRGFRDHPTTRGLRAYAPTLTSNAGLEALVGYPGEEPVGLTTVAYSDGFAAGQGLLHVLAGLLARGDHGGGAAIEVSQHEACVLANGHNLVACQLGEKPALDAVDGVEVTRAEDLPRSGWVSDDLYTEVVADGLPPMELARLPWRVGGSLPAPTAAGPRLGAHTGDELRRRLAYPAARVRGLARSGALT